MCLVVSLCCCIAPAASAATAAPATSGGSIAGLDVMTATVMQEKQSSFSGIALRMRIKSPRLIQGFEVLPTVEYWRNSNTVEPFGIHTTRKDATLGADIRYAFRPTGTQPYVGAGFGLHFLSSSVDAPSLGINDQSNAIVRGGLSALAGLQFPLAGRFENFVELKYHHVPHYRQLKLNWGLSVKV
jgi:opacity protein-like surface antigen